MGGNMTTQRMGQLLGGTQVVKDKQKAMKNKQLQWNNYKNPVLEVPFMEL
jgi:hypothetical protein